MADKAMITNLQKIRSKLTVAVAVAAPLGGFMTWLAEEGRVGEPIHRVVLQFVGLAGVGLMIAAATLLILTSLQRYAKAQEKREQRAVQRLMDCELRRDKMFQELIEEVAARTAEEFNMDHINAEFRKLD